MMAPARATSTRSGSTRRARARPRITHPADNPPIDCFYIYPTASTDPTLYSDLVPDAEELRSMHGQAARLGAQCRLFVPAYHQLTITAMRYSMAQTAAGKPSPEFDFTIPYRDVPAAWRSYLAHDNKGRGVVLVGHSQGAISC